MLRVFATAALSILTAFAVSSAAAQTPAATQTPATAQTPAAATAVPSTMQRAVVPDGVAIAVALTDKLSSQDAKVGQRFGFETTQAVTLGTLQVPAKTPGHGTVASVAPAKGTTLGALAITVVSLDLPDGRTIIVRPKSGSSPQLHRAQGKAIPIPIPFPAFILFGAVVKPNYNVEFEKGTTFQVESGAAPVPVITAAPVPPTIASPAARPSP